MAALASPTPTRRVACALGLAFTAFYGATTRGTLVFGDDLLYFRVTQAIVERGAFDVSTGARGDVPERTIPGRGGLRYSKYGLGFSAVAVPAFAIGRWLESRGVSLSVVEDANGRARTGTTVFAAGLTNAVVGGLAVMATLWLVLELGCGLAPAALVASLTGGATFFSHYAAVFLSETLSALLLTVAVAGALRAVSRHASRAPATSTAALSGIAGGLAVLTRVAHVVAVAAVGVWLLVVVARTRRDRAALRALVAWGAGAALGLAAVAAFNAYRFGDLFETGYGAEARNFSVPLGDGLAGLVASPGKGVLWYAPPLLLAFAGWSHLARRRPAAALLSGLVVLGVALVFARYYMWWGGGAWGPRFLVPLLPIALAPAACVTPWSTHRRRLTAAVWSLVVAAGVVVSTMAWVVPFEHHRLEPTRAEIRAQRVARSPIFWQLESSPIVALARELPRAGTRTARLLLGLEPLPGPGAWEPGLPDLAFAWYRSPALLGWTRAAFLSAALAALYALRLLRGSDELGATRPPT